MEGRTVILWDETPDTPWERRKQQEADEVAAKLLQTPREIGSDSPETRDRKASRTIRSDADWQGYYREFELELNRRERKQRDEAKTLAAWAEALELDRRIVELLRSKVLIAWAAWIVATIWLMLIGNGLIGR